MFIRFAIATFVLTWLASPVTADGQIHTDVNLVTALDVSDSVMRHEEWLEVEGLAKAVMSAAVLDAIAGGPHGRISFTVHTWSSAGRFEIVVPWTLIESVGDAKAVAITLRGFAIDRSPWKRHRNGSGGSDKFPEHQTDISRTIDFAASLALAAPHVSQRAAARACPLIPTPCRRDGRRSPSEP
jgi:hypothetical protein